MKLTRYIIIISTVLATHLFANSFGYLRQLDASFCMADCSQYSLDEEDGSFITYLANTNDIDLSYYINRYVEIVANEEYQCIECSAMIIESIQISDACDYPVACFVDPCDVADECQLNMPVNCVSSYCDGCYADFYDMNGNLVDCYNTLDCTDLSEIFFGICDMFMGYGYVNGQCEGISGCGWEVDGVDYSDVIFDSMAECEEACVDVSEPTCNEIENEYEEIHSGEYDNCSDDSDCVTIWGDCDVGLGGCHYSVNSDLFNYDYSDDLVDQWVDGDCMQWVCDCMPPPNSICSVGECELTYCDEPNPAGCFDSGCQDGYECVDFGNSGYADFCVASSCFCDESYIYQSYWICTEDCNGGTCIPEIPEAGDLCIFEETTLNIPGFADCNGECMDYTYYEWLGDGWCDDGWGYSFNCEALDFDGGDCVNNCNSGDVNNDNILNVLDIVLMVECILNANDACNCSDLNQDGQVNIMDIIILVGMIIEL